MDRFHFILRVCFGQVSLYIKGLFCSGFSDVHDNKYCKYQVLDRIKHFTTLQFVISFISCSSANVEFVLCDRNNITVWLCFNVSELIDDLNCVGMCTSVIEV